MLPPALHKSRRILIESDEYQLEELKIEVDKSMRSALTAAGKAIDEERARPELLPLSNLSQSRPMMRFAMCSVALEWKSFTGQNIKTLRGFMRQRITEGVTEVMVGWPAYDGPDEAGYTYENYVQSSLQ